MNEADAYILKVKSEQARLRQLKTIDQKIGTKIWPKVRRLVGVHGRTEYIREFERMMEETELYRNYMAGQVGDAIPDPTAQATPRRSI